jgi:hypothetical protein
MLETLFRIPVPARMAANTESSSSVMVSITMAVCGQPAHPAPRRRQPPGHLAGA